MSGFLQQFLDEAPKALLAAAIPAIQFLWKWISNHNRRIQKDKLLARIKLLANEKETFEKLQQLPKYDLILAAIDMELNQSIDQLVELRHQRRDKLHAGRGLWARWLLLYTPSGTGAWIVHTLFFANLGVVALGVLGLATGWETNPERYSAMFGLAIFMLPAIVFQMIANKIAKSHEQRQNATLQQVQPAMASSAGS